MYFDPLEIEISKAAMNFMCCKKEHYVDNSQVIFIEIVVLTNTIFLLFKRKQIFSH